MDISINKIANAYYCKTKNWHRDFFAPRHYDGVVLFAEGEIEYYFSNKVLRAKKGDLLFLPGNIPYSGKLLSETVAFFVIDFSCAASNEFEQAIQTSVIPAANYNTAFLRFSEAVEAWNKQCIDVHFKIKSFIYSVLSDALKVDTKDRCMSLTETVIDYICENISDPSLSVKKLCEKFYISESQLRRNILKQTGMRPNAYIMNLRINMAKNELAYTAKSVADISESCGFLSPYYFSSCFAKNVGLSPIKYRKSM